MLLHVEGMRIIGRVLNTFPIRDRLFTPFRCNLGVHMRLIFNFARNHRVFMRPHRRRGATPSNSYRPSDHCRRRFTQRRPRVHHKASDRGSPLRRFQRARGDGNSVTRVTNWSHRRQNTARLFGTLSINVRGPLSGFAARSMGRIVPRDNRHRLQSRDSYRRRRRWSRGLQRCRRANVHHFSGTLVSGDGWTGTWYHANRT